MAEEMLQCQTPDVCKILQVQRKSQDFPWGKRLMGNRMKARRMLVPLFFSPTDIHEEGEANNPFGGKNTEWYES